MKKKISLKPGLFLLGAFVAVSLFYACNESSPKTSLQTQVGSASNCLSFPSLVYRLDQGNLITWLQSHVYDNYTFQFYTPMNTLKTSLQLLCYPQVTVPAPTAPASANLLIVYPVQPDTLKFYTKDSTEVTGPTAVFGSMVLDSSLLVELTADTCSANSLLFVPSNNLANYVSQVVYKIYKINVVPQTQEILYKINWLNPYGKHLGDPDGAGFVPVQANPCPPATMDVSTDDSQTKTSKQKASKPDTSKLKISKPIPKPKK